MLNKQNMQSTPKKRKLNQDEIPRITYKWLLTMIINEQQTMPYYLSDELASKPYNHNLR
jgi:hypothetical protein